MLTLSLVPDGELIPFTSFFAHEKVSIPISSKMTFHDTIFGLRPLKTIESSWINYYFTDNEGECTD